MSPTVARIIAQIDTLSPDERSELASAFLGSLEPSAEIALAWEAEVRRRLATMPTRSNFGVPSKDLFENLRQRSQP